MVSASGPISTGILAGRPSGSQGPRQSGGAEKDVKAAENAKSRHESDLYVRPSWTDAAIALDQLEKVRFILSYTRRAIHDESWFDYKVDID